MVNSSFFFVCHILLPKTPYNPDTAALISLYHDLSFLSKEMVTMTVSSTLVEVGAVSHRFNFMAILNPSHHFK
jgi:hypothetical protein